MARIVRSRVAAAPAEEYDETSPAGFDSDTQDEIDASPYAAPEMKRNIMRRPTGPVAAAGWGDPIIERRETVKAPYLDLKKGKRIIHLLDEMPVINYRQHFINSIKRGYTCIQEKEGREVVVFCPLCDAGHFAGQKYVINVVDMENPDTVVAWTFGKEVSTLLQDHASEKRNFPLNREDLYFQVWRTQASNRYTNHATPLKAVDVEEDYGIDPLTSEQIEQLNEGTYGAEIVWINTEAQLQKIADDLTEKDLGN